MTDLIEQVIKQVAGSMAIEGFILTEEDKERIRRAAEGSEACAEIIQALIQKHTVKGDDLIDPSADTKLTSIDEAEPNILVNRARCRKCGSFLESHSVHDFQRCSCGAIAIDGGLVYLRRCAKDLNDIEELSQVSSRALSGTGHCLNETTLYEMVQSLSCEATLNLCRQAKTEEEQSFWFHVTKMNFQKEQAPKKALDLMQTLHLAHENIIVLHMGKGIWEDQARPVESFMDMNHLPLKSGGYLDMDDFEKMWVVYLKEE